MSIDTKSRNGKMKIDIAKSRFMSKVSHINSAQRYVTSRRYDSFFLRIMSTIAWEWSSRDYFFVSFRRIKLVICFEEILFVFQ